MNKTIQAHIALFLVSLIYAGNYTIAKEVMPNYIQPFGFVLLRGIAGTSLFWLFHQLFIKEKVERKDFKLLLLCGLFGIAINQLFFFKGLNWTVPINASLIMLTSPIMVLIFSFLLGKEKIYWNKIIGILIGAVGAGVLITYGKQAAAGSNQALGDIFIMVNAASYGIYLVIVRTLIAKYHPITVVKWVFTFGLLLVFPFGIQELTMVEWSTIPTNIWLAIFYVLTAVTFLTYLLNAIALKSVTASIVSAYIYLQPILATIIAISFGKDELSWVKVAAGLLIFIGVYLVSQRPK